MKFFIIFRHWADVFGLLSFFWRVCWNCILRVHRNTLGKKMFFKKYSFPIFLDKKRIFLRNFVGISSAGLSKMKFAGAKKNFATFFLKIYSSNLFRTLTESLPGFSKENLGVFVKTGFSLSNETFGKKIFSLQNLQFVFFWKIERENFVWLSGNIQEVLKLLSTSPGEPFEKKVFKKFLQRFSTIFSIITGNCAANVWWACQNCILRIYWNNLKRKTVLENNLNFSSFLDS